jgi:predicted HD superfamily hydrolase involved in NAD metabolism
MTFSNSVLRERVLTWLDANVPAPRLAHSLRVEAMAIDLARYHGLSEDAAAQAGLMHDLAKYFQPSTLLAMARQAEIPIDPVDEACPHLLHAEVSAVVARQEFQVSQGGILAAIANHTLGQPAMDALSCIVFLADSLEPGRGNTPTLNRLRELSYGHLTQAVYQACDYTLTRLVEKQRPIHPRAIQTRNWFLAASRRASVPPPVAIEEVV